MITKSKRTQRYSTLSKLLGTLAVIMFISISFSCEKDTDVTILNEDAEDLTNISVLKDEPDPPSGCVQVLDISRGTKTIDEQTQTKFCESSRKWCWLWFQPCDEKGTANGGITKMVVNSLTKELELIIYLDKLTTSDREAWNHDISLGYIDLTDTVCIKDELLLKELGIKNPIYLIQNQYPLKVIDKDILSLNISYFD